MAKQIAVIGGGVNGLCIAWELTKAGHAVVVFERDRVVAHTSRASSKLLHGGLRYLEHGEFRLVREALRERDAWLQRVPELAKPLRLTLPIYDRSQRGRHRVGLGLWLYDRLAASSGVPPHRWLGRTETTARHPELDARGLVGAFEFWDGQMDDCRLGLWIAGQARQAGAVIHEQAGVDSITVDGDLRRTNGESARFDMIVNAAGPWAWHLLFRSGIDTEYELDLVRGSHIVLNRSCAAAYLLEVSGERRIFFVLPWQQGTLVGTTEHRETQVAGVDPRPPDASRDEIDYLLNAYNRYFREPATHDQIRETFSGLRPLVKSSADPSRATREYVLERCDRLISVFGGKWTTACALARQVRRLVEADR